MKHFGIPQNVMFLIYLLNDFAFHALQLFLRLRKDLLLDNKSIINALMEGLDQFCNDNGDDRSFHDIIPHE